MARVMTPWFGSPGKPEKEEPDDEATRIGDLEEAARVFMALGFEAKPALMLALNRRSPSEARELIRHGCSHELAHDILL